MPSLLLLAHLIGLVLAAGAATAKLALLVKTRADHAFVPAYISAARLLTRWILVGLLLLTLSGIGWLLVGYPLTSWLAVKLVLVGAIWAVGPVIDKVAEPRFRKAAEGGAGPESPEFIRAHRQYLLVETIATGLFWVIIVMWVLQPGR